MFELYIMIAAIDIYYYITFYWCLKDLVMLSLLNNVYDNIKINNRHIDIIVTWEYVLNYKTTRTLPVTGIAVSNGRCFRHF
jgi:hypothetical protein